MVLHRTTVKVLKYEQTSCTLKVLTLKDFNGGFFVSSVRAVARFQNKTRQVSRPLGGSGSMPPQKILKFRGSELLF